MAPTSHAFLGQELKSLLLLEPKWTIAVSESLTCGNVQALIGAVSGASHFFAGGVTAYSLEQKAKLLGVDPNIAALVNSVSREVAEAMARGACTLFEGTFGVSTTGYAEPSPDQGVSFPLAWWAICFRGPEGDVLHSGSLEFPGANRVQAQKLVAEAVLGELVEFVRRQRGAGAGSPKKMG